MKAAAELTRSWGPFEENIRRTMKALSLSHMDEEAEFLWFVLTPFDLRGLPFTVWPADRDQQQHDGWPHEEDLRVCVPVEVELSENLTDTPDHLDDFRDACAEFLLVQWNRIQPQPGRLAYFSLSDDGWYFSLRDGRKISAWDIGTEIDAQRSEC